MRTSPPKVNILLVDDYEPFRRFVRVTLKTRPELHVIDEVSDGLEAVQKAKELKPDLILLDIGLPKLNGIEASKSLSQLVPDAKILFISQNNDAEVIAAALSNGANGYVLKQSAKEDLLSAVDAVLEGNQFLSSQLAETSTFGRTR